MPIFRSMLALVLVCLVASAASGAANDSKRSEIVVATGGGPRTFKVEIVDDDAERARGLMFRRALPADEGMLFDFKVQRPVGFWMRNTYVPLDMLFIKENGTVESIAERATPLSEQTIASKNPVRYVLEINAGLSRSLGIRSGDKVSGPAIAVQN